MSTAMFPLGSVFLPGDLVPLKIFEPRYVRMMHDLLASAGDTMRFGSVLIERGTEVGGQDERRPFGVYIEVEQMIATAGGGYSLVGRATSVLRVDEWAGDNPYPRATTSTVDASWDDSTDNVSSVVSRLAQSTRVLLHEYFDLEGVPVAERSLPELTQVASGSWALDAGADDVVRSLWTVARHVPVGPEDRYGLLSATTVAERVHRISETIAHASEVLAFRRGSAD